MDFALIKISIFKIDVFFNSLIPETMKQLITALILFLPTCIIAQKNKNVWYFGIKAGIDFNIDPPVALTDGQMNSYEGCSSIADSSGNLLFYTNGGPFNNLGYDGGVWNKNHELMPNGVLSSITSCNSSVQSSLIVPDPKNQYKYYIFTTDCQENGMVGGLRYHVVDMSLANGFGDVVIKDVPVMSNVTESITAVKHSNGQDYWLIIADYIANTINSLLITKDGISPANTFSLGYNFNQTPGQLSATIDGSKIGFAATYKTFLIDFNNNDGSFSNLITLDVESLGCTFSPNNAVFYACKYSSISGEIYQFDLNATDVPSSVYIINSLTKIETMQLAPDGKIYIARIDDTSLPVISNPNEIGIGCNYTYPGFYLNGKQSKGGLPNFVNQYINKWCDSYADFEVESTDNYDSPSGNYTWNVSGLYQDTIGNVNGCDSLININLTITNTNKIGELSLGNQIRVYPNPSNGKVNVDIGNVYKEIDFYLYDNNNLLLKSIHFEDSQILSFDFLGLSSGIYRGVVDVGTDIGVLRLVISY